MKKTPIKRKHLVLDRETLKRLGVVGGDLGPTHSNYNCASAPERYTCNAQVCQFTGDGGSGGGGSGSAFTCFNGTCGPVVPN